MKSLVTISFIVVTILMVIGVEGFKTYPAISSKRMTFKHHSWVVHPNHLHRSSSTSYQNMSTNNDDGVVELIDDEPSSTTNSVASAAPFLSQGEISKDALNPDLSDPKQTRVIIYIIVSLLPVLFLIPLMLGSRDLIPLDSLPPVTM